MKIPKSVKVGSFVIKIDVVDDDEEADGLFNIVNSKIRIRNTSKKSGVEFTPEYQQQLMLHEILHAIDEIYLGNRLREKIISVLAYALYQVIKDNQEIFKGG